MPVSSYALLDGSTHSTAELKGKVTIINFWATSCSTCVKEMPQIVATHEKYKARGLDTLLIAGTVTNTCCESTARDASMLGYKVVMLSDANAARERALRAFRTLKKSA